MALVIEDGTIVTGADSWVTRAEFITYAANLGVTVADADATDTQLRKAAIFICSYEDRLKGDLVERDQPLCYPRQNLVLEGFTWLSTEIPRQVKLCQMQYALDLEAGIDIYNPPQSEATGIKRERIEGAVEVEYAVGDSQKLSRNSTSKALLSSLLRDGGLYTIPLVRY